MVPVAAVPFATGYPQPGKAHGNSPSVGYCYPQNVASYSYSDPSYPNPSTSSTPYPTQSQYPYPPVNLKKDSLGYPPPMGTGGGYSYYAPNQ